MAFDPNEVAQEQEAKQRITVVGQPTEFAQGPEQEGVQVAGVGKLFELLNKLEPSVRPNPPKPKPVGPEAARVMTPDEIAATPAFDPSVAPRMPLPQEIGSAPNQAAFSESATKRALAGQVLTPQGVAKFEERGLKAPGINEQAPTDVLQDAQTALANEAEASALAVNQDAKKALNAEVRGFNAETGTASDEVAQAVLSRMDVKNKNIQSLKDGGDFNYNYVDTPDDIKAMITAVGEEYENETVARTRGKISNDMTIKEAEKVLLDEIGFTRKLLNRRIGEGALTASEFLASREILVNSASKLVDMAEQIRLGAGADVRLRFRRQLAIHSGIQLQLKGAQTEAARALQSFQIRVDGELDATRFSEEAQRLLSESGAEGVTDALASALLRTSNQTVDSDKLKAINELADVGYLARTKQMVHEAYLAGLLSSPATQMKNIGGTLSFMLFQLPAEAIGGFYGSVDRAARSRLGMQYPITEDQAYMEDVLLRLKGWSDSFSDALKAGSIAWRTESPAGKSKLDIEQYASTTTKSNNVFSRALDDLTKRMRIPFRMLLSVDEFTKTISQRGEHYTLVNQRYQHALRQGMTEEEALDEAGMMLLDPGSVADEINYKSKYDTLQSDLGTFGEVAGKMQRNLIGRFIMPFVTAPTNSIMRTMEYIPAAPSRSYNDLKGKNGERARQIALGKYTLGLAVMSKAHQFSMDGRITGGMPQDKTSRDALPQGWQPYSFVLKGEGFPEGDVPLYDRFGAPNGPLTYVNFQGFEPVGGLFAIAADTAQRMNETNDPKLWFEYPFHATLATMDYYTNLPMLQGIADVVALTESKDPAKLARSYAESAASPIPVPSPVSSLERMFARMADPTRVKPREDFEYYTLEDIRNQVGVDENGGPIYRFALPDGRPDYRMVGLPKSKAGMQRSDPSRIAIEFFQEMNALQAKDSFVRQAANDLGLPVADERDLNAVRYDTLGNVRGSDEFSFAANPGAALFSNLSGLRLKRGEELEDYEKELIRLQRVTNKWPLNNPEKMGQIKLSYGMQSDLANMAKNQIEVSIDGYGKLKFRDAIAVLTSTKAYKLMPDGAKVNYLRDINSQFIERGFLALLENPEYANMRQAYEEVIQLKKSGTIE
jgi:hypothetical protein